jgi:ABC-type metal ion transport system, periplasmic component/surface antigen
VISHLLRSRANRCSQRMRRPLFQIRLDMLTEIRERKFFMKRSLLKAFASAAALCVLLVLAACGGAKGPTVAIPNDTTNEARALLLLEAQGFIRLRDGAGIAATPKDVESNPKNIQFKEVEAAQLPNVLRDVDYAVINSNYAIAAGLDPVADSLAIEGSASAYANILAVKQGRESDPLIRALAAALCSRQAAEFIAAQYGGAVVSVVDELTDGYDPAVDYAALAGQTVSAAASPTPHAQILEVAKELLAAKGITLEIVEFTDYVQPNNVVESGELDANYFQHVPYLEDFNTENGTHLVSAAAVHVEPMGLYGGKQGDLGALQ